ncbi:MAG: HlyD family efflux transporter periplasmic adaptor subunit [Colwellia sp.]|nr:HlyD family efflux transporter periplasmic adaptor subunit [Colwellia sp.]
MDIVRSSNKKRINKNTLIIVIFAIAAIAMFWSVVKGSSTDYVADKNTLLTAQVERGELYISVRGTGVLVPKDIRWIATNVSGRVERILIKAGAQVKTGDLLLVLSNPQLEQSLEETRWELEALEAQTKAQEVNLESQLLDQEAAVINEKLNYERALLTFNAQKRLQAQGSTSVSKIKHEEVKIEVAQNKQRWELEIKRLAKTKENIVAQNMAYQAQLNRMRKILARAQTQVDNLHVLASMDSVVQAMPMELGQQVNMGTNLALLARTDEFIAELRVPEKMIQSVMLEQTVTIDTRHSKITGVIKRIDPAVVNGSVQVDVELTGDLPAEARPDLTVDGIIDIARIANTLYVKRPMYAKASSDSAVYQLDHENDLANRRQITYGQISTQYIQIKSGLKAGDTIIVSDSSDWEQHQQIQIN